MTENDEPLRAALLKRAQLWTQKAARHHRSAYFDSAARQALTYLETRRWPLWPHPLLAATRQAVARTDRLRQARQRGTHTEGEWWALLVFCEEACVRCGSEDNVQKDHIVPLHMPGSSDHIENIQPLCGSCNGGKDHDCTDYRPDGWREAVR